MISKMQQIRNADGKLLCELSFDGRSWNLEIKRRESFTKLILFPSGSFSVLNTRDGEVHSSLKLG